MDKYLTELDLALPDKTHNEDAGDYYYRKKARVMAEHPEPDPDGTWTALSNLITNKIFIDTETLASKYDWKKSSAQFPF